MDSALLAYSGISVKMLVDRGFGADLLTMFTVDYELGGAAQAHDHPFEETYFFLEGRCEGEIDGTTLPVRTGRRRVRRGRAASMGSTTSGTERVRWIETQAPQPPARHAYRWSRELEAIRGGTLMSDEGAVVVVGGTRGIGLEIARHYAGTGHKVVVTGQTRRKRG